MAEKNHILEVKNLRVSYHTYAGEVKAVRGVSFELEVRLRKIRDRKVHHGSDQKASGRDQGRQ